MWASKGARLSRVSGLAVLGPLRLRFASTTDGPLSVYMNAVESHALAADQSQIHALKQLQALHTSLKTYQPHALADMDARVLEDVAVRRREKQIAEAERLIEAEREIAEISQKHFVSDIDVGPLDVTCC